MTTTNTVEVVYNASHGGFSLSEEGFKLYNQKRLAAGLEAAKSCIDSMNRLDKHLIEVVKELGTNASGYRASLEIDTIPIEYLNCYEITEYDGWESVLCDQARLIEYKLWEQKEKIDSLSDLECRQFLLSLIRIIQR